jgi:hypothetical protein
VCFYTALTFVTDHLKFGILRFLGFLRLGCRLGCSGPRYLLSFYTAYDFEVDVSYLIVGHSGQS